LIKKTKQGTQRAGNSVQLARLGLKGEKKDRQPKSEKKVKPGGDFYRAGKKGKTFARIWGKKGIAP